jgi:hypothetical protein
MRNRTIFFVSVIGTVLAGFIALTVIVGVVFLSARDGNVPDVLKNWGGIIIGFFFGQFFSLVQSMIKPNSSETHGLPANDARH